MNRLIVWLLTLTLFACADSTDETIVQAAAIEAGDQCHLCGMMIAEFPGPKGELVSKGETEVVKFCSTKDLFAHYLQPENQHRAVALYVHDMAEVPWESPEDEHFIDARAAHYVWGSSQKGAMGSTLASFAEHEQAMQFADAYGGSVVGFDEITLELLGGHSAPMEGMDMMEMSDTETGH